MNYARQVNVLFAGRLHKKYAEGISFPCEVGRVCRQASVRADELCESCSIAKLAFYKQPIQIAPLVSSGGAFLIPAIYTNSVN